MLATSDRWTGLAAWARSSINSLACLAVCGCSGAPAEQAESSKAPTAPAAAAAFMPGISGMATAGERTYLLIHDSRDSEESRAGLWRLDRRPPVYEPLHICDESLGTECLADLESIAAIPNRPGEFLVLESGAAAKDNRRRALARVKFADGPSPQLKLLGWEDVWPLTSELSNCESLVCWQHGDDYFVLIADRMAAPGEPTRVKAIAGRVDLPDDGTVHFATDDPGLAEAPKSIESPAPSSKSWRACTDLCLDQEMQLWGVSAEDRGDAGPFRSTVFRVGALKPATAQVLTKGSQIAYECDGLKLEALARATIGGATLCFGSDDERFGGAWRTLPVEARPSSQHSR